MMLDEPARKGSASNVAETPAGAEAGARVEGVGGPAAKARRGASGTEARRSVWAPGILLGLGLGGFVDGIVLHQILQWHHMLSDTEEHGGGTLSDFEANVTADGMFHAAAWLLVLAGVVMLWRVAATVSVERTWRSVAGWMLFGWGLFNLSKGIIDHHVLRVHRVRPDAANPLLWDLGFLALGALLVVGGWVLQRTDVPGGTDTADKPGGLPRRAAPR